MKPTPTPEMIEAAKKALVKYSVLMPVDAAISDAISAALSVPAAVVGEPVGYVNADYKKELDCYDTAVLHPNDRSTKHFPMIPVYSATSDLEAVRIGDEVLSWMVKYDLLDAGNEYRAEDVVAVLNDLAPYAAPSAPDGWQLEWRPVVGWEDYYEVSNTGRMRKKGGEPVGQWPNNQGYMLARLSNPRAVVRVHRSVADAFIPNPDNLPFVNHVDNDRAHNCDLNLEWCTQKENLDHSRRQGRMPDNYWVGKRSPNASLDDDIVAEIRRLYASGDHSYQALGEKFGISKRAIGRLINRETYTDV